MSLLHPMIRDDEGKRFGLAFINPFEHLRTRTERVQRLQAAGRSLQRSLTRREWGRIGLSIPFILPIIVAAGVGPSIISRLGLPLWTMPAAMLPMAFVPVTVTVAVMRLAMREHFVKIYITAGYCPSCVYDLRSAETDAMGRRTCAECGGVWRIEATTPPPSASQSVV